LLGADIGTQSSKSGRLDPENFFLHAAYTDGKHPSLAGDRRFPKDADRLAPMCRAAIDPADPIDSS
jgi:hypothetical protein